MSRNRKASYYQVWSMKDGTVVMALPTREVSPNPGTRKPAVDRDGCHGWNKCHDGEHKWSDWANSVVKGAIVNQINFKRLLRAEVEPRLERIERQMSDLNETIRQLAEQRGAPDIRRKEGAGRWAEKASREQ